MLIDLSHTIEHGMITYKGLPPPVISDHLSRQDSRRHYERAQRLSRLGRGPLGKLPVPGGSAMRDLPEVPSQTFREWWRQRPAPPS